MCDHIPLRMLIVALGVPLFVLLLRDFSQRDV
jgi:hypothetical protein